MGWIWKDDGDDYNSGTGDLSNFPNPRSDSGDRCSTRRIVKSQCKTEEVEPGKFIRKCEKTEEVLRECLGRPVEVLQSNKEYTEDDVSDQVLKGSHAWGSSTRGGPFDFPGLRSDMKDIERSIFGNLDRFFDAAEEMRDSFFNVFRFPSLHDEESRSSPSIRRGIPIQRDPYGEGSRESRKTESGDIDLDGLAKDV